MKTQESACLMDICFLSCEVLAAKFNSIIEFGTERWDMGAKIIPDLDSSRPLASMAVETRIVLSERDSRL